MEVAQTVGREIPVLQVTEELDHVTGPLLLQRAQDVLGPDGLRILFDLEACTYIDSGGVCVFLVLLERVKNGGWVGIVSPSRLVLRIFEIAGLTCAPDFKVFPSALQAHEYCSANEKDEST